MTDRAKNKEGESLLIFTVVDLETTGLFKKDRIVELAAIRLNDEGEVLADLETLVNPMRDIGNSHIHGISAKDVAEAPTFEEIAGDLLEFLKPTDVVVGHNLDFDLRFLRNEFGRCKYAFPEVSTMCTMSLVGEVFKNCPRNLNAACALLEIPRDGAHSAFYDAKATAQIFIKILPHISFQKVENFEWEPHSFGCSGKLVRRGAGQASHNEGTLSRLVGRLPSHGGTGNVDFYFEALDRAFADAILEEHEARELITFATELGLSADQVVEAHRTYVNELVAVAEEDGFISDLESEHIAAVAKALDVDPSECSERLKRIELYPRDLRGKNIVFSGELQGTITGNSVSRSEATALVERIGVTVKSGVSKKVDLVVVKDPYTMSSKAKKARELGVPLVSEQVFWNWIGVQVQ